MPTKPLKKGATYADLVRVPEHYVAEMFDGDLYASPRPAAPHIRAATKLAAKLDGPFDFDGPGGWILLVEPELTVLVFRRRGWSGPDYDAWSSRLIDSQTAFVMPTRFQGEPAARVVILSPRTTMADVTIVLDAMG